MTGQRKKVREEFKGEQENKEKNVSHGHLFPANTQGDWGFNDISDYGEKADEKKRKQETKMGWYRQKKR